MRAGETAAGIAHRIQSLLPARPPAQQGTGEAPTALPKAIALKEWDPRQLVDVKMRIHRRLLSQLDMRHIGDFDASTDDPGLRAFLASSLRSVMDDEGVYLTCEAETLAFVDAVLDEMLGYSQLEDYLRDPSVSEIMVNGPHQVFIERDGRIEATDTIFLNEGQLMRVIDKIVSPVGRRVDESSPMVDARLPDGSRVNAVIPPLSLNGPVLTVRKFSKVPLVGDDLVRLGSLSDEMLQLLKQCVQLRYNILISGGTGSGKTTLLNAMSSFIPESERIITIEDAAELKLNQAHVISLEARPPNTEGRGSVAIRDLVRNALRMRPDRIIVGEVRGPEALDMLQAMNTGHSGSLTTCHANSPKDALARLETMVLMAGMDLPLKAVRGQIAGALDIIVQQSRLHDGSRKVTRVTQVVGMADGEVELKDLHRLRAQRGQTDYSYEKTADLQPREADDWLS